MTNTSSRSRRVRVVQHILIVDPRPGGLASCSCGNWNVEGRWYETAKELHASHIRGLR